MKRLKDIKIWLVALVFVGMVGILFGAQTLATKFKVTDPLQKKIMGIRAVKKFSLEQTKAGLQINLELKKVSNLGPVLDRVQHEAGIYYDQPVTSIRITGHTDRRLEEFRYRLAFNLEEAMISGRYLQLRSALDAASGIKARVYFSRNFIYLQLEDGDNYHYEAYARPAGTRPAAQESSGGISGGDTV
ncbi:MAG TPA: hypothetical protein VHY08_28415 [Bacillota bacterium]|nr:hypothetical protein [Bacillota bacterium]